MALETLAGLEEIGGFKVTRDYKANSLEYPIYISDEDNIISFKIQNKPVKETGINGCQVDTLIETALIMIEGLNEKFPCQENVNAAYNLVQALANLKQRKRNRETRGVEGTSQE